MLYLFPILSPGTMDPDSTYVALLSSLFVFFIATVHYFPRFGALLIGAIIAAV